MLTGVFIGLAVLLVFGLLYWQFIIAEGAYLGSRVVVLLYDWAARSYDRIKDVDAVNEAHFLAQPILDQMRRVPTPLILDVATGTGRLPMALLKQVDFRGHIVGLDLSARMLRQARQQAAPFASHVDLIRERADTLPFRDQTFDLVTCLEALEFMPDPEQAIAEMVRVLRPGGMLVISNRVGWEARFLWGRACGRGRMEQILAAHPLRGVRTTRWQVHYDLVWARRESGDTT